jgi:hypothetical protein
MVKNLFALVNQHPPFFDFSSYNLPGGRLGNHRSGQAKLPQTCGRSMGKHGDGSFASPTTPWKAKEAKEPSHLEE